MSAGIGIGTIAGRANPYIGLGVEAAGLGAWGLEKLGRAMDWNPTLLDYLQGAGNLSLIRQAGKLIPGLGEEPYQSGGGAALGQLASATPMFTSQIPGQNLGTWASGFLGSASKPGALASHALPLAPYMLPMIGGLGEGVWGGGSHSSYSPQPSPSPVQPQQAGAPMNREMYEMSLKQQAFELLQQAQTSADERMAQALEQQASQQQGVLGAISGYPGFVDQIAQSAAMSEQIPAEELFQAAMSAGDDPATAMITASLIGMRAAPELQQIASQRMMQAAAPAMSMLGQQGRERTGYQNVLAQSMAPYAQMVQGAATTPGAGAEMAASGPQGAYNQLGTAMTIPQKQPIPAESWAAIAGLYPSIQDDQQRDSLLNALIQSLSGGG